MPQFDTAEQGSTAWLMARLGHLTASRMAEAMAFTKKGEPTAERTKYMFELCAERLTDRMAEHYVTPAMQHGIESEPLARDAYEVATGNLVQQVGFARHDEIEFFGASSDGLVGVDGMIEIKCQTTTNHLQTIYNGVVPEKYKPQLLAQCAVLKGRSWCDFVAFDPRVAPEMQLFIRRFTPTAEEIAEVEEQAKKFLTELNQMFDVMVANVAA